MQPSGKNQYYWQEEMHISFSCPGRIIKRKGIAPDALNTESPGQTIQFRVMPSH